MDPCLRLVAERFPQVEMETVRLFERDEDFREVCLEYQACTESVARFEAAGPSSESLRKEYAALLLRLEGELLRYLKEHPNV